MTALQATQATPGPLPLAPAGWPWWLVWLSRLALAALGLWLLLCLLVALFQRRLIYHPVPVARLSPPTDLPWATAEALHFTTADGLTIHGWRLRSRGPAGASPHLSHRQDRSRADLAQSSSSLPDRLPPAPPSSPEAPVVLYFCGNAGHRGYRLDEFEVLLEAGAEVCCFDYRGYGDNPGSPTERDLRRDARSAWELLTGALQIPPERIVLLGESLGGGVATRLAAELCSEGQIPGGLILRSTFNSLREIAATQFTWVPVNLLLLDPFESQDCIGRVTCPLLSLHGERDSIVPLASGRALFNSAPATAHNGRPKTFVPLPRADHNDVLEQEAPRVRQALDEFLSQLPDRS